jgi:hypothetical protein
MLLNGGGVPVAAPVAAIAMSDPLPPQVPGEFHFFTDAALTTPGLVGSYFDQNLQGDPGQNDWRLTQTIAGTRVDPDLTFINNNWGKRADVGLTHGTDLVWQQFSVQWDGYVKLVTPHLGLTLSSDNGSRMWIDINGDGTFDATPPEYTNDVWGTTPNFLHNASSPMLMPGVYKVRIQFAVNQLNAFEMLPAAEPQVRIAYVIPSNRTPQAGAVAELQQGIVWMQKFYRDEMDRYGFGPKTFNFETESDGVTPKVWIVHVNDTDANIRTDLFNKTINDAAAVGVPAFASGQDWLLVPETHVESSNGTITGSTSLGASFGSGLDGGEALIASDLLPFLDDASLTNDLAYGGRVFPGVGPFPMVFGVSQPGFNGSTISSLSSVIHGDLIHELTHGFGLPHDQINDDNFHGNLMYNGFRGFRGWAYPYRYPSDDMTLGYAEALALSNSDYFNPDRPVNASTVPAITSMASGSIPLVNGLLPIHFTVSDPLGLAAALLTRNGDIVGALPLSGTHFDGTITTPYFTKGHTDTYGLLIYDQNGNRNDTSVSITPGTTGDAAPQPFIKLSTATIAINQQVILDATKSTDPDDTISTVEWDVGDGNGFTPPSGSRVRVVSFSQPGTHLIRARLTDASGKQSLSNPLALRVLPPGPNVSSVTINDGSAQRSSVSSVTVTFDQPVTLNPGAIQLFRRDGLLAPAVSIANPSGDGRTYLLTFSGGGMSGGSLPDAIYNVVVTASAVIAQSTFAQPMPNPSRTFSFLRLYGDATGDGDVDAADVALFRTTLGKSAGDPGYLSYFDFDGNGKIDSADFLQLRFRIGKRMVLTSPVAVSAAAVRFRR